MSSATASGSTRWVLFSLLFLLLLLHFLFSFGLNEVRFTHENGSPVNESAEEMVPVNLLGGGEEMVVMMNNDSIISSRRKLGSFQICALCTCCGGARGYCLPSPCCYSINCNIPNRPFGFCAFTPKTCNCFGCHL